MKTNRNGLLFRIIVPVLVVILVAVAVLSVALTNTIRKTITQQRQTELQGVADALMHEFEMTKEEMPSILAIILDDLMVRGAN